MPKQDHILPCPCGSGRPVERCCGPGFREAMPASWHEAHQLWPATHTVVFHWALAELQEAEIAAAMSRFARVGEPGLWAEDGWQPLVESWLIYDWQRETTDQSLADQWLEQIPGDLDPRSTKIADMTRAAGDMPLSLYQVEGIEPGRGVELRDLLLDLSLFVNDVNLSLSAKRWNITLARLLPHREVTILDAMAPFPLDPTWRSRLLDELEDWIGPVPWREPQLRADGTVLFELYDDAVEVAVEQLRAPQRLANTDGDPMVLCELRYRFDTQDHPTILHRLLDLGWVGHEGLELDDPDQDLPADDLLTLHWHDVDRALIPGGGPVTVATLGLERNSLLLSTNSRQRRDRVSASIERELAPLLRRPKTDSEEQRETDMSEIPRWTPEEGFIDPRNAMHKLAALDPTGEAQPPPIPPELQAALDATLATSLEAAARDWVDESVPALGGLTPRQAMDTERGRRAVEDLLRSFDDDHARSPGQGMDLDLIRRELDLPVPSRRKCPSHTPRTPKR